MKRIFTLVLFWIALGYAGRADDLKRIMRLLEKSDIQKAVESLKNGLKESPNHAGYLWIAAEINSTDTLSFYNLDSAYILIKQALVYYDSADQDQLKAFEKVALNMSDLIATDQKIRNLHWVKTQQSLSIEAILSFRKKYPEAPQETEAIYLRDSLAYEQAKNIHSWQSYQTYIEQYPQSAYYQAAREQYEYLLYNDKTGDRKLKSYQSFVEQFPQSPYREQAIGHILSYMLFWNDPEFLIAFVNQYSQSKHSQTALEYIYHMAPPLIQDPFLFNNYSRLDSLHVLHNLNQQPLFFYPTDSEVLQLNLKTLESSVYPLTSLLGETPYCQPYIFDYLLGEREGINHVINRAGYTFYAGDFTEHIDVGLGVILLKKGSTGQLIHKTGKVIARNIEAAGMVDDQWIKVRRNNKWTLLSLNGQFLSPFEFDAIERKGRFWIFEKDGLYAFTNKQAILNEAGTGGFTLIFKYDDYEIVDDQWMIGFKGEMEGLINADLSFIIPWDLHQINPHPKVPYAIKNGRYYIYPQQKEMLRSSYSEVLISKSWLAVKAEKWRIRKMNDSDEWLEFDSVRMIGDHQIFVSDSVQSSVLFETDTMYTLIKGDEVRVMDSPKTSKQESYLLVKNKDAFKVFTSTGVLMMEEKLTDIKPVGDSVFVVTKNKKVGLIDKTGSWVIENKYDFISKKGSIVNLLLNKKIGAYIMDDSVHIQPQYGSNLESFGSYFLTTKDMKYGLLDKMEQQVMPFQYNQLDYISDSLVWVKTDSSWQIQDIHNQKVFQYGIRSFERISTTAVELFIVSATGGYGLLTASGQYLITPSFSDIRVIGTGKEAIFLCEKAVPEAGFYLWVGFDQHGKRIFSEAYREDFYELIACD